MNNEINRIKGIPVVVITQDKLESEFIFLFHNWESVLQLH